MMSSTFTPKIPAIAMKLSMEWRTRNSNLFILSGGLRLPAGHLASSVKTACSTSYGVWSRVSGLKGRCPNQLRRMTHINGPPWTRTRNAIKPRIYSPLRYQFRSPTHDDSCGIWTRHLLAENQKSWTVRRRSQIKKRLHRKNPKQAAVWQYSLHCLHISRSGHTIYPSFPAEFFHTNQSLFEQRQGL